MRRLLSATKSWCGICLREHDRWLGLWMARLDVTPCSEFLWAYAPILILADFGPLSLARDFLCPTKTLFFPLLVPFGLPWGKFQVELLRSVAQCKATFVRA
jgi:hypothetical protein